MATLDSIIACANRTDDTRVVKWFQDTEKLTLKALAKCPKEFVRLDRKLSEALNKVLSGALGRTINEKKGPPSGQPETQSSEEDRSTK